MHILPGYPLLLVLVTSWWVKRTGLSALPSFFRDHVFKRLRRRQGTVLVASFFENL